MLVAITTAIVFATCHGMGKLVIVIRLHVTPSVGTVADRLHHSEICEFQMHIMTYRVSASAMIFGPMKTAASMPENVIQPACLVQEVSHAIALNVFHTPQSTTSPNASAILIGWMAKQPVTPM